MINYSFLSQIQEFKPTTFPDIKNAMREVIQRIILCGLAKGDFFDYGVFYGGTSLRIFRGLPRFSEDLDFLLVGSSDGFEFDKYLRQAKDMLEVFGLDCELSSKTKNIETTVDSAFFKFNLKALFEATYPEFAKNVVFNEALSVKIEIERNTIAAGRMENLLLYKPNLCRVRVFGMETLFASKLVAVLNRKWGSRTKGRDFYDYLFYLSKNTKIDLGFLERASKKYGYLANGEEMSLSRLKNELLAKFSEVDFDECKKDVLPFVKSDDCIMPGFDKETFLSSVNTIEIAF